MINQELLRIVDSISRDKNIDRESIFVDIETAMVSGIRKHFGTEEDFAVQIDRETGQINAFRESELIDIMKLGRIPAQTVKQVMIQKLREDERGSIFTEFQDRVGEIVTGTVARFEGGVTIVNLHRTEALMPRNEQIPGESQHPGERVRAMILEVKESPSQVKIILSRTHPEFIRRLFEQEVPEVSDHTIEIKGLSREAGYRTKVAVVSSDSKVDAVGACVGVRGSRIKNIVDELGGEKIDIVRWNESSQVFITNALRPAEIQEIALCFELNRATVVVSEDQLSLAIGKRGQNVRLAARLTNWDIDILTPTEFSNNMESLVKALREVPDVDDTLIDRVIALGIASVLDLEEIGPKPLVETLGLDKSLATEMIKRASAEARRLSEQKERRTAAQAALASEEGGSYPEEIVPTASGKMANLLSTEPIDTEKIEQPQSDGVENTAQDEETGASETPSDNPEESSS
jgi:N utilization substance protein A